MASAGIIKIEQNKNSIFGNDTAKKMGRHLWCIVLLKNDIDTIYRYFIGVLNYT